jgi:hypothetical protein
MLRLAVLLVAIGSSTAACSKATKRSASSSAEPAGVLIELHQPTGENRFARNIYVCAGCSPAQLEDFEPPQGWEKVPPKRFMTDSQELRNVPSVRGAAREIDLVPAVPGNEHHLVGRVIEGELLDLLNRVARVKVRRSTHFEFKAGREVHELIDDHGSRYILFVVALDFEEGEIAKLPFPRGWTYSHRRLKEALSVDSKEETTIVSFGQRATWQRY